ncbi:MAG: penicillin-binding protein 1C [Burkholderiales bacterium]|jgi:penicillin-binding protein 1C|nr:penicillin-binding protein 1C [Burkholderiales bacterium]
MLTKFFHHRASRLSRVLGKLALALIAVVMVITIVVVAVRLWPKPPLRESIPSSVAVYDTRGALLRLTLARDEQYRLWMPLSEIPPELIEAVQLHEDQYFYYHPGVNLWALARAAMRTYSGGARQGASTLTMQLARLLYKLNTRTPWGKFKQIVLALTLEARYSKDEILEAYLNAVPYGQNVKGVAAASLIYFGKRPQTLSLPEILSLAVIPQSPSLRTPGDEAQTRLSEARMRLFERWAQKHPEARAQAGLVSAPLNLRGKIRLPFEAPHFTTMLLAENTRASTETQATEIQTTLDLRLQKLLERQMRHYLLRAQRQGLKNGSALLVDWTTMEVKAWLGSADFFDASLEGQVNGVLGKRSPGSTLKPFIYALAIDQGILHPMTVLKDSPQSFGPFTPENFDGTFAGPISAQQALIRSRNIPAVVVNAQLKKPSLYEFLWNAHIAKMADESHYGLALTLGGGEVTVAELAALYAIFPNQGRWQPLVMRKDNADSLPPSQKLLSGDAAFITLDMLEKNPRPDVAYAGRVMPLPVAWKTGTSWGFRDAWTAGVFGRYVLVVWLGNFDGSSNQALVGVDAAAPLFFSIADALMATDNTIAVARRQPQNAIRIDVCQASGDLPNADCPRTVKTWFIPGVSPIKVSELHRAVMVDTRTGKTACPPYDSHFVKREVFEYWPSDLRKLFVQAGMPRRLPPPPADCGNENGSATGTAAGVAPRIISPLTGVIYQRRLSRSDDEESGGITLQAIADGDVETLYWFFGTNYLGASASGKDLLWKNAPSGRHTLRVVDDHGRADTRTVAVELIP